MKWIKEEITTGRVTTAKITTGKVTTGSLSTTGRVSTTGAEVSTTGVNEEGTTTGQQSLTTGESISTTGEISGTTNSTATLEPKESGDDMISAEEKTDRFALLSLLLLTGFMCFQDPHLCQNRRFPLIKLIIYYNKKFESNNLLGVIMKNLQIRKEEQNERH